MSLNLTSNLTDPFSCYHPSVEVYRYFGVALGCAVTLGGALGNALTLLALAWDRGLHTRFNVLILNLSVADLLYCAGLQPFTVDSYLHLHWRWGGPGCSAFALLLFLSNAVSIITLCLIAAARYLMVARGRLFNRVFGRVGLALLVSSTWALGLASFGPLWGAYGFVTQVCTCSFHRTRGRPYSTILLVLYFFVGLACVGVFYFLIHRKVKAAAAALERHKIKKGVSIRATGKGEGEGESGNTQHTDLEADHSQGSQADSSGAAAEQSGARFPTQKPAQPVDRSGPAETSSSSQSDPTQVSSDDNKKQPPVSDRSDPSSSSGDKTESQSWPKTKPPAPPSSGEQDAEFKRVTRMCFAVFLCFVLCYAPFLLVNALDSQGRAPQALHMFCANMTWLNSCINPVLYAAMNRRFNQAYRGVLARALAPLARLRDAVRGARG
ncbi:G-protein coupled receptor 84 [Acipenser ruthenus]|uniref:G-protein coupled receptor 84 n=1 Tax=Acipenser ruthenus TaxID=7906 RepID=UPI0027406663|nr:G-protein coupled receptor 84 [Acipenser ruthenus]